MQGMPHSRNSSFRAQTAIFLLSLVIACFAVYFNTLSNGFVYDDEDQVLANPWIRDARYLPEIFTSNAWAYTGQAANYYRPVMHIAYMINFHLFGLNPTGFHFVNILLHSLNSILVYYVFLLLLNRHDPENAPAHPCSSFLGALLFATHPIHTEAVAWVSGIPELTFTFFGMLSLLIFIRSRGKTASPSWADSIVSALMLFIATLCKETALVLPVLLLVYDRMFPEKRLRLPGSVQRYVPYIALALVYFGLRYHALQGMAPVKRHAELSGYQYLINVFPILLKYVEKLILPVGLNVFYAFHPLGSIWNAIGVGSVFFSMVLLFLLFVSYKKSSMAFLGILVTLIPLLPALYIPGLGENPFAERYLYFSSIGFVLLMVLGVDLLRSSRPKITVPVVVACCMVSAAYSYGTIDRNRDWKDDYTLWEDTVRKSPDAPIPNYNFGLLLYHRGEIDKAIRYYQNALRLEPSARVYTDLGLAYVSKGFIDEGIRLYQKAIWLDPQYPLAYNNLGVALNEKGLVEESISPYLMAIRLSPKYADAYNNLGYSYLLLGRKAVAVECFRTALQLDPNHVSAQNNLFRAER